MTTPTEKPKTHQTRLPELPDGYRYIIRIIGPDLDSEIGADSVGSVRSSTEHRDDQIRLAEHDSLSDGVKAVVKAIRKLAAWEADQERKLAAWEADQERIKRAGQAVFEEFGGPTGAAAAPTIKPGNDDE